LFMPKSFGHVTKSSGVAGR